MKVGQIEFDGAALARVCEKWGVAELAVFGSALRDDFRPDSDIDLLVTFRPEVRLRLLKLLDVEAELSRVLGRPVDLVERMAVEENPNWILRRSILESAQLLHVA